MIFLTYLGRLKDPMLSVKQKNKLNNINNNQALFILLPEYSAVIMLHVQYCM